MAMGESLSKFIRKKAVSSDSAKHGPPSPASPAPKESDGMEAYAADKKVKKAAGAISKAFKKGF